MKGNIYFVLNKQIHLKDLQGWYVLANDGLIRLGSLTCPLCNGIVAGMLWLSLTDEDVLFKSQIFKSKEGAGLLLRNISFACS